MSVLLILAAFIMLYYGILLLRVAFDMLINPKIYMEPAKNGYTLKHWWGKTIPDDWDPQNPPVPIEFRHEYRWIDGQMRYAESYRLAY